MKIKTNLNVLIVESTIAKSAFDEAKKLAPKALKIVDEKGNDVHSISFGEQATVRPFTMVFNTVTAEGNLAATFITDAVEDVERLKEQYGVSFSSFAKYEDLYNAQITAELGPISAVFDGIERM